jgi:hypothetical protein
MVGSAPLALRRAHTPDDAVVSIMGRQRIRGRRSHGDVAATITKELAAALFTNLHSAAGENLLTSLLAAALNECPQLKFCLVRRAGIRGVAEAAPGRAAKPLAVDAGTAVGESTRPAGHFMSDHGS